ncbi:MAG: hypothetical protein R3B57_11655 [Phycisphaerales bacterium]
MTTPDQAKKLDALLKRLEKKSGPDAESAKTPPAPEGVDPIVHALVHSFMVWEAGPKAAAKALNAFASEFVDYNELRICMSDELAGILPKKYPAAEERCERLRVVLNEIFARQHALTLAPLAEQPKREARAYLDALGGITPFVAARVSLLALGAHGFPVDARLAQRLAKEGVCDADETPESVSVRLERHIRAGQAEGAYLLIEAWSDGRAGKIAATGTRGTGRSRSSRASSRAS